MPPLEDLRTALRSARQDIQDGQLPSQMVERAAAFAEEGDAAAFVDQLQKLFNLPDTSERLDEAVYVQLAESARMLELDELGAQILEAGISASTEKETLELQLRRFLVRSSIKSQIAIGRHLLEEQMGFTHSGTDWSVNKDRLVENVSEFGLLIDALEALRKPQDALMASELAYSVLPTNPRVLRNYGRTLADSDDAEDRAKGVRLLREAVHAKGSTDVEAAFLAATLSRHGEVDGAVEAYFLAASRDPDDAENFIRSGIALLIVLDEDPSAEVISKLSQERIGEIIPALIEDAMSCRLRRPDDASKLKAIFSEAVRLGIPVDLTLGQEAIYLNAGSVTLSKRAADAKTWYDEVKSDLTLSAGRAPDV